MISFNKTRISLSDVLLKERPEKYKYNPYPTYSEGVLFLVFIKETEHLQAIDLSLSEQSLKKRAYNIYRITLLILR